jgi:cytochrome c biogenesis protein CcmG, thiol:disulfide interchange protein DsbE
MKWRFAVPVVVFAVLFGVLWLILYRTEYKGYDPREIRSPLIGKPAPRFRLPTVEDPTQFVDNSAYAGQVYVFNVWGTWCAGCRQEHPVLLEIARQKLVPIVGLDSKDTLQDAQTWLNKLGNPYAATAFDAEGRVSIDWGVYGAPETFLIDASGHVVYKFISPMTMEVWESEFIPRIQKARAAGAAPSQAASNPSTEIRR